MTYLHTHVQKIVLLFFFFFLSCYGLCHQEGPTYIVFPLVVFSLLSSSSGDTLQIEMQGCVARDVLKALGVWNWRQCREHNSIKTQNCQDPPWEDSWEAECCLSTEPVGVPSSRAWLVVSLDKDEQRHSSFKWWISEFLEFISRGDKYDVTRWCAEMLTPLLKLSEKNNQYLF